MFYLLIIPTYPRDFPRRQNTVRCYHDTLGPPSPTSALCVHQNYRLQRYLFLFVKVPGASLSDVRWIFVAPLPRVSPPHPNMIITPAQGRGVLLQLLLSPRCTQGPLSVKNGQFTHLWISWHGPHLTPDHRQHSSGRAQAETRVTSVLLVFHMKSASH